IAQADDLGASLRGRQLHLQTLIATVHYLGRAGTSLTAFNEYAVLAGPGPSRPLFFILLVRPVQLNSDAWRRPVHSSDPFWTKIVQGGDNASGIAALAFLLQGRRCSRPPQRSPSPDGATRLRCPPLNGRGLAHEHRAPLGRRNGVDRRPRGCAR